MQFAFRLERQGASAMRMDTVVQLADAELATQPEFVSAWDDLSSESSEPNAFNESWYLLPALRQFDPSSKVRLFVLWENEVGRGRILGIIPFSTETHYGHWRISSVQNWLHPNAFLGCPSLRRGYEDAFWHAFLAHLDADTSHGLFFHLNGVVIGGSVQIALERVCSEQSRRVALVHQTERALLDGNLSPQDYYEDAVRTKKRKELRRQKNRLAELGTLSFTRSDGSTGLGEWTEEFLGLERRGWKGANGSALDCMDTTRELFSDALAGAAMRGKLELLDLRLDGAPLAMLVNFLCTPGCFSFKTAFDEDYARFSPGVLLQIENLALLERGGTDWCDSCAVEGHPMIDSLWTGRRIIGRYSVAIGRSGRRAIFAALLRVELTRASKRKRVAKHAQDQGDDR
jgi:Acetyltransferase (GNAT) domain